MCRARTFQKYEATERDKNCSRSETQRRYEDAHGTKTLVLGLNARTPMQEDSQ
jgi:hypothetical protein